MRSVRVRSQRIRVKGGNMLLAKEWAVAPVAAWFAFDADR